MRIIVLNERTDLQGLRTRLLGHEAVSDGALERLQNLNPHVSFKKIPAGTVLLIPDLPGLRKGESSSVTGDSFEALREQLLASVSAACTRARGAYDAVLAQQKEVSAAVNSTEFKRALEADSDLKEQVAAGTLVFRQDQEQAKAADETLKALQKQAGAELEALAKLLA